MRKCKWRHNKCLVYGISCNTNKIDDVLFLNKQNKNNINLFLLSVCLRWCYETGSLLHMCYFLGFLSGLPSHGEAYWVEIDIGFNEPLYIMWFLLKKCDFRCIKWYVTYTMSINQTCKMQNYINESHCIKWSLNDSTCNYSLARYPDCASVVSGCFPGCLNNTFISIWILRVNYCR